MARVSNSARKNALRSEYRAAKAARAKAGKAFRKSHTQAHLQAYRAAERKWQIIGSELGKLSGTHNPSRKPTPRSGRRTKIFSSGARWTGARFPGWGRRRKTTRSRRSR